MGTSSGFFGTARARYHLRQCFVSLYMPGINRPEVMIGNAGKAFDGQSKLADATSLALIRELPGKLVGWTRQLRKLIIPMTNEQDAETTFHGLTYCGRPVTPGARGQNNARARNRVSPLRDCGSVTNGRPEMQ